MDEVLYAMPTADLKVLAAIVQAMCSNEIALRNILQQNGADIEPSGLMEFLDMVFEELKRRKSNDE